MVSRPSRFVLGFTLISVALLAVPLVMFAMLTVTEREYELLVDREAIADASDRLHIAVLEMVAEARRQASTPGCRAGRVRHPARARGGRHHGVDRIRRGTRGARSTG